MKGLRRAFSFNRIRLLPLFWAYSALLAFNVFQDALARALTHSTETFFIIVASPSLDLYVYQVFLALTLTAYSSDFRSSLLYLSHPLSRMGFVASWLMTSLYLPTLIYVLTCLASIFVLDPGRVSLIWAWVMQMMPTLLYASLIALLITWLRIGPKATLALSIFAFFVLPFLLSTLTFLFSAFDPTLLNPRVWAMIYAGAFVPVYELLIQLTIIATINVVTLTIGRRLEL